MRREFTETSVALRNFYILDVLRATFRSEGVLMDAFLAAREVEEGGMLAFRTLLLLLTSKPYLKML